jgi:hypothetical protein
MREIRRFFAVADDGTEYVIVEHQEIIDAAHHGDKRAGLPGMKRLATLDGRAVNYIDSETFQIVETDEIVRKI